jgi:hypothetical protein
MVIFIQEPENPNICLGDFLPDFRARVSTTQVFRQEEEFPLGTCILESICLSVAEIRLNKTLGQCLCITGYT